MNAELEMKYRQRHPLLEAMARSLEVEVLDLLRGVPHVDRVYFRAKEPSSFLKKATKDYEHPLVEIEDQVAGRVLVFFLDDVDCVVARLKENFNTVESKRRNPERHDVFGYESF